MLSFVYNGASIHKYKGYWDMSFSLINGYGTHKNNIHGQAFIQENTQAGANQGFTRIRRGKSGSESVVNAWKRQGRIAAV